MRIGKTWRARGIVSYSVARSADVDLTQIHTLLQASRLTGLHMDGNAAFVDSEGFIRIRRGVASFQVSESLFGVIAVVPTLVVVGN